MRIVAYKAFNDDEANSLNSIINKNQYLLISQPLFNSDIIQYANSCINFTMNLNIEKLNITQFTKSTIYIFSNIISLIRDIIYITVITRLNINITDKK
ncbi:hypothetical protein EAE93_01425 [Photorhabdus akhurstii]|nr:hypothetical protein [Photorhabdus akhurstii]